MNTTLFRRFLISLLCLSCLCICLLYVDAAAKNTIIVRAGIYENNPKIFTDAKGKAAGFWPDILNFIAEEEGWEINWVHGTWQESLERLTNNEIDVMPDVAFTEERKNIYTFSDEAVYTSWTQIYTRKDTDILSILDLEGKIISVLKGSVNVEGPEGIKQLVQAFDINCIFIEVDSYNAVFDLVKSGVADAGVTSKDFGYHYQDEFNLKDTPIIFQPSRLYFAFPQNSNLTPLLIEKIDTSIRKMKQDSDSIYHRSLRRWFAQEPIEKFAIPGWLIWLLVSIAGIALILATFGLILRSQVRSRTRELTGEITRRKQVENELRQYEGHLEELVKKRTAELEQANLHKSQFLANMSHELRTPLNSIIGYTKLMLDGMEGDINTEQKEDLQIVYDNSKHLLSLINDLLDLSKIESGKFEILKETFHINELISKIIPGMDKLARDKGLELSYVVSPGMTKIYADKNKTKQVLFNLLGNAVKFTQKGRVCLEISENESEFVFSVQDTGIGIAKEDINVLFTSYKQVGPARLDGSEGTGLGLVISKQFIEKQGGKIWVESVLGQGSKFIFTLPKQ